MRKRFTKVLALGLTAAMLAGIPLPAMAEEAAPVDAAVESEVAAEDAQAVTDETAEIQDVQPEIAMQASEDETALTDGVDPLTLDGLVQLNDGNWYYMENCKVSDNANGTVKPVGDSWWYVGGYRVDFSYNGFGRNGNDKWYVENGQVQFGYTGIVTVKEYGKAGRTQVCYVRNGRLDTEYTGLAYGTVDGVDGWYSFHDGYNFREGLLNTGKELVEYNGAWWYVSDERRVDFSYTGIAYNEAGGWYVRNGQVDFSFTGMIEGLHGDEYLKWPYQYYFANGKLNEGVTGLYYTTVNGRPGWYGFDGGALATFEAYTDFFGTLFQNDSGWWYVDPLSGSVLFNYTGLAKTAFPQDAWYHYWYVENGRINFNYTGFITSANMVKCYVKNGQVDETVNGVYQLTVDGKTDWYGFWRGKELISPEVLMNPIDGSWWYVNYDGKVDFSYTGLGTRHDWTGDTSDSWYIRNGQVDFSYSGCVKAEGYNYDKYYVIQNGRFIKEYSGLIQMTVNGVNAWWQVEQGCIEVRTDFGDSALVEYNGDWWYVAHTGQVDFSYNGFPYCNGANWYVKDGRVIFGKTGFVNLGKDDHTYEYVENSQHDYRLNGLVYAELNGKTTWWSVQDGRCYHYDTTASWRERPDGYAAKEDGLWAIINGEIAYDMNGVYKSTGRYYWGDYDVQVVYTYHVVDGLVTDMQTELHTIQ